LYGYTSRKGETSASGSGQVMWRTYPEKDSTAWCNQTVPQTDTGGQVEKTKANERNMV